MQACMRMFKWTCHLFICRCTLCTQITFSHVYIYSPFPGPNVLEMLTLKWRKLRTQQVSDTFTWRSDISHVGGFQGSTGQVVWKFDLRRRSLWCCGSCWPGMSACTLHSSPFGHHLQTVESCIVWWLVVASHHVFKIVSMCFPPHRWVAVEMFFPPRE